MYMEPDPQQVANALAQLIGPILDAAAQARPGWLLLGLALHSASLLCRVRIWQTLLRAALPGQAVSFGAALGPYLASVAANVVAPLRGGDAVRIGLVRRTVPEASSVAVLATLAAEAIPGLVVVPLLVAVALLLGVLPVSPAVAGALVIGAGVMAYAAWLFVRRAAVRPQGGGRLARVMSDFASGLQLVGSPRRFARTVGPLTALDWALRIATIAALLAAFRIGPGAAAAAAVVAIDSLSTMIPLLPNGAGAQQTGITTALQHHASTTDLLAFSMGVQLLVGAVNVIGGVGALTLLGLHQRAPLPAGEAGVGS
jgi:uncharacterized membrane protein YbhN (UPF0104 family)